MPNTAKPTDRAIELIWFDRHVVVVNKPAGLSTVTWSPDPEGRGPRRAPRRLEPSVADLALRQLPRTASHRPPRKLGIVQRLDRGTSGVLVFTRTREAERNLALQFRGRTIDRDYIALASGIVKTQTIRSNLIADRGDGRRGTSRSAKAGKPSTTHVEQIAVLRNSTLIRCRLETGRTHQIRIHLAEIGHPLLGDHVYSGKKGNARSEFDHGRFALHALSLGFFHPESEKFMRFEIMPPQDMLDAISDAGGDWNEILELLRGGASSEVRRERP